MDRRTFLVTASATAFTVAISKLAAASDFNPTSLLYVRDIDAVAYRTNGKTIMGSPAFGKRDGYVFRYFASEENAKAYSEHSGMFPDIGSDTVYAFGGADIVARYPHGVSDPRLGTLVAGNSDLTYTHGPGIYRFASKENRQLFIADPKRFTLPVGAYCVGAMSRDGITPGTPPFTVYLWPVRTWAVFGSANGLGWAALPSDELETAFRRALANYEKRVQARLAAG